MLRIENITDIWKIRREGLLPGAYIEELETYFKGLVANLTGEERWKDFDLSSDGPVLVLTKEGDLESLAREVFGRDGADVYSVTPEFCNRKRVGDAEAWQIFVLCSNDYVLVVYAEVGLFGKKFDEWIAAYQTP